MPHFVLPEGLPGIRGPMMLRPETAKPINDLVNVLLHDAHSLSASERERIATCVPAPNDCPFCQSIHGAIAAHHLGRDEELVQSVKQDYGQAGLSKKLKALSTIAGQVPKGGKWVTADDIDRARSEGATDLDIHDAVPIAAVFCVCNQFVDGLANRHLPLSTVTVT